MYKGEKIIESVEEAIENANLSELLKENPNFANVYMDYCQLKIEVLLINMKMCSLELAHLVSLNNVDEDATI